MAEKINLALYSVNCKKCSYLDPDETKRFTACHYTKGNAECPAAGVQLVVTGKARKLAKQLQIARDSRNADAESSILKQVSTKSAAFQSRFYDHLEHRGSDE